MAHGAADFLSHMHIDPNQSLELELLDSFPVKHRYEPKTPDASKLTMEPPIDEREDITRKLRIPQALFAASPSNDALLNLIPDLKDLLDSAPQETFELHEIRKPTSINSLQEKDLLKCLDMIKSPTAIGIASIQKKNGVFIKS